MSFFTMFITLSLCQIAWIVLGVLWVVRKHDEIPLLISILLFYVFTFRFWTLLLGGLHRRILLISASMRLMSKVPWTCKPSQFLVKPSCFSLICGCKGAGLMSQ